MDCVCWVEEAIVRFPSEEIMVAESIAVWESGEKADGGDRADSCGKIDLESAVGSNPYMEVHGVSISIVIVSARRWLSYSLTTSSVLGMPRNLSQ